MRPGSLFFWRLNVGYSWVDNRAIAQVILAPARMLWYTLGRERYMALYSFLDNQVGGLDKFGTSHGGKIAGTTLVASSVLAGGIFMRQAKKQVSIVKA